MTAMPEKTEEDPRVLQGGAGSGGQFEEVLQGGAGCGGEGRPRGRS
jgi:hypothetical protein